MKPWKNEFPVDKADDMDDAARRILLANIRAGMSHESCVVQDAQMRSALVTQEEQIKADLKRFQETGELPDAWEVEPELSDAEFDRRVDEINRELEAIESGCVEPPPLGWLCQIGKPR